VSVLNFVGTGEIGKANESNNHLHIVSDETIYISAGSDSSPGTIHMVGNEVLISCKLKLEADLVFLDGSIQTTAYTTPSYTTPSYTTTYSQDSDDYSTLTVVMPVGVTYIDLTAICAGGDAGVNSDFATGYYSGGSGGGGQLATNSNIFVTAGDIIEVLFVPPPISETYVYYTPIGGVPQEIAHLYNGKDGGNSTVGAVGIAGIPSPNDAIVDANFGSWVVNYGTDGAAGVLMAGGTYPTMAVGGISGTGYTASGQLGCGRLFKNSGGANQPATSTPYIKGLIIAYHF
jgi:hypothetical protein